MPALKHLLEAQYQSADYPQIMLKLSMDALAELLLLDANRHNSDRGTVVHVMQIGVTQGSL